MSCVSVVFYNPSTKLTAVTHIDRYTDISSLGDVITKFLGLTQVRLIGGNTKNIPAISQTAMSNVQKVVVKLLEYENLNIVSADIMHKETPSAFVFDPMTGVMTQATPYKYDNTLGIRTLFNQLCDGKLLKAFEEYGDIKCIPQYAGDHRAKDFAKDFISRKYFSSATAYTGENADFSNAMYLEWSLIETMSYIKIYNSHMYYVICNAAITGILKQQGLLQEGSFSGDQALVQAKIFKKMADGESAMHKMFKIVCEISKEVEAESRNDLSAAVATPKEPLAIEAFLNIIKDSMGSEASNIVHMKLIGESAAITSHIDDLD